MTSQTTVYSRSMSTVSVYRNERKAYTTAYGSGNTIDPRVASTIPDACMFLKCGQREESTNRCTWILDPSPDPCATIVKSENSSLFSIIPMCDCSVEGGIWKTPKHSMLIESTSRKWS